jgi:hypothetical protein
LVTRARLTWCSAGSGTGSSASRWTWSTSSRELVKQSLLVNGLPRLRRILDRDHR